MTGAAEGWPGRAAGWLRAGRGGLFLLALLVGAGSGLGAVVFRYLIYFFTWAATGHSQFGQQGHAASAHLPWLGVGFFVVIPVIGGLLYGPLIYRFAREARGHGVPEVMIAVADNGGRIRPQVSVVKAVASALCIGAGGSVGREGPIVQIGSALASSLGQWVKMPENRLRILVACGAGGGIAATFNAPITGVFFGVEIILREFSIDALFTVMLAAMIADITAIPFLGDKPFLSGFPAGIELHHAGNYLLVAVLAVVAALMGLAFKAVLYKTEDLCDRLWQGRPEWARPAVGGIALGLLLLAIPQMYGVGYPVMYKATAGQYALWFLILLAFAKIAACSLTIGIGGSGGHLRAVAVHRGHLRHGLRRRRAPPFRAGRGAARPVRGGGDGRGVRLRRPRPADLAGQSVVEMTGDFALTLPVMLAVAIASMISRALSYGTIYTTKLLRRGTDIDRTTPWRALADLKIADAMRPFRPPLPVPPAAAPSIAQAAADGGSSGTRHGGRAARAGHLPGRPAGPVRHRVRSPRPCGSWRSTATTACRSCPRRPPDTRLGHRTRRAGRHRPPDHQRAGRDRPGPGRRRLGPRRPGRAPAAPADPAARIPGHRDHHHPRLARRGTQARRLTWPPGSTPVISPARPPAPPAPARPHPRPRRPHQPAHRDTRQLTRTPSGGRRPHPAGQRREQQPCVKAAARHGC